VTRWEEAADEVIEAIRGKYGTVDRDTLRGIIADCLVEVLGPLAAEVGADPALVTASGGPQIGDVVGGR